MRKSHDNDMTNDRYCNLFIYSDSLAFRRVGQPADLGFAYPFVLKELLETRLGLRVNLLVRGRGGARIGQLREFLNSDSGFFSFESAGRNIAVFQVGIVDCAPRPFTYALVPLLKRIRFFGPRIIAILRKDRSRLQGLWSYVLTPKKKFAREYAAIIRLSKAAMLEPIAVGMPLPPAAIEERSPGFCASVIAYNETIRTALPDAFCDIESKVRAADREKLLMQDGHHLTEAGHQLYAECIFEVLTARLGGGMHLRNTIVLSPTQLPITVG
jgi:hypothetical protein